MLDLSTLNPGQSEAVLTTEGPLLVLAGAGSGKTRVLTYRIAHLVEDLGVMPWNILAVTFTNKAAKEMRERLSRLIPYGIRGMWVYTFHSMCVRMLRADAELLGFTKDFTIYDADDTKRLVKEVMNDLGYDTKRFPDNAVRNKISTAKNELNLPGDLERVANDPFSKVVVAIYRAYQQRLKRANAMDFDDLLLNAYTLLKNNPDVADAYGQRFKYILVDEYQDTNHAQYAITKILAQGCGNLMVVGDDDQSIYSWRGADIRNILEFERDWPETKTVKLEQNYRSTGTILEAANNVIANNASRKPKRLFTESPMGDKVSVYLAADERDEGRWIAGEIEKLHDRNISYSEIAVFYRTNAQSRVLEDMFLRAGVPYQIVGGTRFFERQEIRDAMAYLKLAVNPADDVSARRIINTPKRGVGKTTIENVGRVAALRDMTFLEACKEVSLDPATRQATRKSLVQFLELVDEISAYSGDLLIVVDLILSRTAIVAALEAVNTDESRGRAENVKEFMGVVRDYCETHDEIIEGPNGMPLEEALERGEELVTRDPQLPDFMEWLSLRTDLDAVGDGYDETVTFMTVHSAKGLEFDYVFVAGMEESIFPHSNSVMEHGVEEERRLAYVAITRARKKLYLTHAQTRRIFNDMQANARSRFVREIPEELIQSEGVGSRGISGFGWEKRGDRHSTYGSGRGEEMYGGHIYGKTSSSASSKASTSSNSSAGKSSSETFAVGDKISHKTFGIGTVLAVDNDKLTIRFAKSGATKKLLKGYAPIVRVDE